MWNWNRLPPAATAIWLLPDPEDEPSTSCTATQSTETQDPDSQSTLAPWAAAKGNAWPGYARRFPAQKTKTGKLQFAHALRSPSFAFLWGGQTISALGDGIFLVALSWSIILLHGSATDLAEVLVAQSFPRLLFLLIGGVVADRLPRKNILFWADSGRAVAVLTIAALFLMHQVTIIEIIGLSIVFGVADGFFFPAFSSIPPEVVPASDLASANALTSMVKEASNIIGPGLGALLLTLTNPGIAIAVDGGTFVFSAACLLVIHPKRQITATSQESNKGVLSIFREMSGGWKCLFSTSFLWLSTLLCSFGNVGTAAISVALPLLVQRVYGEGVWLLGLLLSASAIGSISGSILIGQTLPRIRHRGIVTYLSVVASFLALGTLGFPILGLPIPHELVIPISVIDCAIFGFGLGVFNVGYYTSVQQIVPPDLLGRVSSIDWLGSYTLQPIALAAVGICTDKFGAPLVFCIIGAGNAALWLFGTTLPGIRKVDKQLLTLRHVSPVASESSQETEVITEDKSSTPPDAQPPVCTLQLVSVDLIPLAEDSQPEFVAEKVLEPEAPEAPEAAEPVAVS